MKKYITKENNELKIVIPISGKFSVLVVGVVHGDEPQGEVLINRYLKLVNGKSNIGFIPVLNPDGLKNNTRVNSNGVDINRNFPAKNWEKSEKNDYYGGNSPASEIETKFLIDVIAKYNPKLILTIHAPYKVVNYDGEAKVYANEISKIIGYPVNSDIGYPTPGSFGSYAGIDKNIPVITLELDETLDIVELQSSVFKVFNYLETLIL